jgi:hypothetical protein
MAIPLYTDFTREFRSHLGDTEVAAGQVWTDASGKCDGYLQQAYSELYKGFEGGALKNITRTVYGNLPAYTSYISPVTLGVLNLSEPTVKPLWERDSAGSVAITNAVPNTATPGSPYVRITAASHGYASGDMVLIFGIVGLSDDVNDQWSIVVQDANTFDLMGCRATGTYSSGGTATSSTQDWAEVVSVPEIRDFPQTPGASLNCYAWINGAFRVSPATTIRQVKMIFYLSAKAPTYATPTASLGFDDCLGFVTYRAAALATLDRVGDTGKYHQLNQIALGPTEQHSDLDGLYGILMRSKDRSAARNPVIVARFRESRRNAGPTNRY